MQLTYRNGTPLYGKTLQGVLGNRPCRVLVAADPTETPEDRRLAAAAAGV